MIDQLGDWMTIICYIADDYIEYDSVGNVQFIKLNVYNEALPISLHIIEYLLPTTVTMVILCHSLIEY